MAQYQYTCLCYPNSPENKINVPVCPQCGQKGIYIGRMHSSGEAVARGKDRHRELYGLEPDGPHEELMRKLFADAISGSVWAKPIEEIIALRRQVLASYPDAASPSSRLDPGFTKKEKSIYLKRKIKLTERQLQRLSKITNLSQQEAIRKSLKQGADIPEYAWHPVPEQLVCRVKVKKFSQYINAWEKRLKKAGISKEQMSYIDPKDAAAAFWVDKTKLARIVSQIKEYEKSAKKSAREILRSILDSTFTEVVEATPYGNIYRGKQRLDEDEVIREVFDVAERRDVLEDNFDQLDKLGITERCLLCFEYDRDLNSIDLYDPGGSRAYVSLGTAGVDRFIIAALSNPVNSDLLSIFIRHLFRENGEDFHVCLSVSLPPNGITNYCPDLIDRDNLKQAIWRLFRSHQWMTYDEHDDLPPVDQLAYFETYFKEFYSEKRRKR